MTSSSLPYLKLNDIDIGRVIGQSNATVYQATLGGKEIAVKKMDCNKNEVPREVEVHNTLPPHSNVLPLLGITHSSDGFTIYICMELADKSLHSYLYTEKKKPSLRQSTKWAIQIAKGMHHLHQHSVAHRDLKSANVLLCEKKISPIAKVCDFGSARPLENTASVTGMTGTHRWMAPEFNDTATTKVNKRCDVFSYGMVLYEIFTQNLPFSDLIDDVAIATTIGKGERPSIPQNLPPYIKVLMESCWKHNPHDRPTFEEIVQVRTSYQEIATLNLQCVSRKLWHIERHKLKHRHFM